MRWLSVSAVLAACTGPAAAQPEPPLVTSPAWFEWYDSLLSMRLSECPLARAQTYYFAQSGDDVSGDGTWAHPWKTIAKAKAVLEAAAPAGGVAVLFRRGDTWRELIGIDVATPNVTIADYGEGAKPMFSVFLPVGDPAGWVPTPGCANVYQRSAPTRVMWARQDEELDRPWSRQRTLAGVRDTPGSWFWDAGVLYVHPRHDASGGAPDPRTDGNLYEGVGETFSPGVRVSGDGSRIENIRAEGWGLTVQPSTQLHGIESRVSGTGRAVIVGCESHYGLAHTMTHWSGEGGRATFVNCEAGLTTTTDGTMFNTYAFEGGAQTIFDHCTATHGTLPSDELPAGQRKGFGFYGHTNNGWGQDLGLTITNACRVRDTMWGCGNGGCFSNLPQAASLAAVRCFMVGDRYEGGSGTGIDWMLGNPNAARVNGWYAVRPAPGAPPMFSGVNGGWVINCTAQIDISDMPGDFSLFHGSGFWHSEFHFWNCYLGVRTRPGQEFRFDGANPPNSVGSEVMNSVIVTTGGGVCRPHLSPPLPLHRLRGVTPSAMRSNGYYGVDAATVASDPRAVVLAGPESPGPRLSCGSPLACGAGFLPGGIVLGFDSVGACGVRNDIGPVEAYVCANCDGSTVTPVLNIQDYTCFLNKFAVGDPAANCDASTTEPVLNIGDFICFQTAFARGCK